METRVWRACPAALSIAALLVLPAQAETPPRRKGADVRVERAAASGQLAIRLCTLPFTNEDRATCFKPPPPPGTMGHVFAFDGPYVGTIQAGSSQPSTDHACHMGAVYELEYAALSGPWATQKNARRLAFAFFGVNGLSDRSLMLTQGDGLPQELPAVAPGDPFLGLDLDADGSPEVVLTTSLCTDQMPPPMSLPGKTIETICLDYWTQAGTVWTRVGQDVFYNCQ